MPCTPLPLKLIRETSLRRCNPEAEPRWHHDCNMQAQWHENIDCRGSTADSKCHQPLQPSQKPLVSCKEPASASYVTARPRQINDESHSCGTFTNMSSRTPPKPGKHHTELREDSPGPIPDMRALHSPSCYSRYQAACATRCGCVKVMMMTHRNTHPPYARKPPCPGCRNSPGRRNTRYLQQQAYT